MQREHPRLLIFHVANERKGSIGAAMHFKRMGVVAGVADFLCFTPTRRAAIELKDDDGDQSEEQELFEKRWVASGGEYHIVRTLGAFQATVAGILMF